MKENIQTVSFLNAMQLLGGKPLRDMRRAREKGWEALISPHFLTRVIQTLYHVGAIDALGHPGGVNPLEYAGSHGLDGSLLTGLFEALFARNLLSKDGPKYKLSSHGRFLVETDLVRGWFELVYGYENVLNQMEGLLKKEIVYGKDLVRDGRAVAVGSGLASRGFYFPFVMHQVRRAGYRRVLDIGCGDGAFLRYLCDEIPGLEGVGVDLSPDAVAAGNEQSAARGMSERVRLYVGDALELEKLSEELRGVDAAATFFVLHELCDLKENPRAAEFLKAYRRALPGVPFHVVETIRPSPEDLQRRPGPAVEYFLFHDLSLQKPIGRDAWKKLFKQAGFGSLQEDNMAFARTSIFTVS